MAEGDGNRVSSLEIGIHIPIKRQIRQITVSADIYQVSNRHWGLRIVKENSFRQQRSKIRVGRNRLSIPIPATKRSLVGQQPVPIIEFAGREPCFEKRKIIKGDAPTITCVERE